MVRILDMARIFTQTLYQVDVYCPYRLRRVSGVVAEQSTCFLSGKDFREKIFQRILARCLPVMVAERFWIGLRTMVRYYDKALTMISAHVIFPHWNIDDQLYSSLIERFLPRNL